MKTISLLSLSFFLWIFCNSCKLDNSNKTKLLIGKWQLSQNTEDSSSELASKRFIEIVFREDGLFTYNWANDDLGNTITGKYFINTNLNRNCETISLIPSIIHSDHGDIILKNMSLDILEFNDKELKVLQSSNANGLRDNVTNIFYKIL